jgi:NAD(P)-dependent dehydrogenase (short-subunit alcohol dehydrogenase family)
MSSMGSQRGIPPQSAYCSSKHGIDGFLESLRVELQRDGAPVSVTQIMPGTINTTLFDNARTKMGVKPVAPPPAYPARVVADAIVLAAAHPVRDLVVGGSAKTLITVEKFAPRVVDALLRWVGYEPPVGAENRVTSCDLHVFVDEAAEPVSSQRPDGCVGTSRSAARGWALIK